MGWSAGDRSFSSRAKTNLQKILTINPATAIGCQVSHPPARPIDLSAEGKFSNHDDMALAEAASLDAIRLARRAGNHSVAVVPMP